jgi:hypothetical protein
MTKMKKGRLGTLSKHCAFSSRGPKGELLYRSHDGKQWTDWRTLGLRKIRSAPAAVLLGDWILVLARGEYGQLVHGFLSSTNGGWSARKDVQDK